jgi:hypothetical protein
MPSKAVQYAILGIIICLGFSCENYKDCNSPVQTSLGIHFYRMLRGREADTTLPALTMYGIGRKDSLLADSTASGSIFVPLDASRDTTAFFLAPDSTGAGDTLTVSYTRDLQFISSGCGFTTLYHIDTVYYTIHRIDSVAVPTRKIITTNATNLKIYY